MEESNYKDVKLGREEEIQYIDLIEMHIKKQLWIPLCMFLIFQAFNMIYILFYTKFNLSTTHSRVYFNLYLIMFVSLSIVGILFYVLPIKWRRGILMKTTWIVSAYIFIWSICLTVYDQHISTNISAYLIAMLSLAIIIHMPTKIYVPMYVVMQIIFVMALPLYQTNTGCVDNFNAYSNSIWCMIISLFLCYNKNKSEIISFKRTLIIERKNKELTAKELQLKEIVKRDLLTNAYTRYYLTSYVKKLIEYKQFIQIYMIDVDSFKDYNDTYGHVEGDRCLKKISAKLLEVFEDGMLFRFGGEEFLGILPYEDIDSEFGQNICKEIYDLNIASAYPDKNVSVSVGASYGIVKSEKSWEKILSEADEALYEAKRNGKNRIIYSENAEIFIDKADDLEELHAL